MFCSCIHHNAKCSPPGCKLQNTVKTIQSREAQTHVRLKIQKHCIMRQKRNMRFTRGVVGWYEMSDVYLCGRPSGTPPTSRQYVNNPRAGWAPIRNSRMTDERMATLLNVLCAGIKSLLNPGPSLFPLIPNMLQQMVVNILNAVSVGNSLP